MSANMLVYCVEVATRPGLCPIAKETAEAAPTLCTEYGPNLLSVSISFFSSIQQLCMLFCGFYTKMGHSKATQLNFREITF